jgi:hypothetical protein
MCFFNTKFNKMEKIKIIFNIKEINKKNPPNGGFLFTYFNINLSYSFLYPVR